MIQPVNVAAQIATLDIWVMLGASVALIACAAFGGRVTRGQGRSLDWPMRAILRCSWSEVWAGSAVGAGAFSADVVRWAADPLAQAVQPP